VVRRCALLLTGVALSALLPACTTAGAAHPPSVISFSYVYGDQSTAVFLQWTSHGHGPVSGTIKIKSIAGSDLFTSPTDTSARFTGTADAKGAVTLTLPDWGTVHGTQQDIGLLTTVSPSAATATRPGHGDWTRSTCCGSLARPTEPSCSPRTGPTWRASASGPLWQP
jgi:hypothetical protein